METAYQSYKVMSMIGKSPFSGDGTEVGGGETDSVVTKFSLGFFGIVAATAIASGAASMYLTVSYIVDFACACLFIVTPIAVHQKWQLRNLPTLRGQHNELRAEVNKFHAENERLAGNNVKLDLETKELKSVEAEYSKLVKERGSQVDRLLAIVKENGEIQARIKKSLQTQVMQQAMDSILQCDTDEDFSISRREIPQFKLRMSRIPGVEFDEANFDALFKDKKGELSLKDVMQLFRNLCDDIPENDNVFHLKPEALASKSSSFLGF